MLVLKKSFGLAAFMACATAAFAQGGASYDPGCWPPDSDDGPSDDYVVYKLTDDPPFIAGPQTNNPLFGVSIGASGSDTYGEQCYPDGATFNTPGRFGFTVGSRGSIQSDVDNFLRLQYGMPYMVGGSIGFTMIIQAAADGTNEARNRFGADGFNLAFFGASDRYCVTEGVVGDFTVRLQTDVIGDAARMSYRFTNNSADSLRVGMWTGAAMEYLDQNGFSIFPSYIYAPG